MASNSPMSPDYVSCELTNDKRSFVCLKKTKAIPYLDNGKMMIKRTLCGRLVCIAKSFIKFLFYSKNKFVLR